MGALAPRTVDIRRIHGARKRLALTEDCYRGRLQRLVGKDSLRAMTDQEVARVAADLGRLDVRPRASATPHVAKVRALWISLRWLGLLENPSDQALAAFVKRQTKRVNGAGLDSLEWLSARDADMVIEALKGWAGRAVEHGGAGVVWADHPLVPQRAVVEAQWRLLVALGAIQRPEWLDAQAMAYRLGLGPAAFQSYQPADWDRAIQHFGRWLLGAKQKRGNEHGA